MDTTSKSTWFEVEAFLDTAEQVPTIKWKYSPESAWAGYYVLGSDCWLDYERKATVHSDDFPERLRQQLLISKLDSVGSCHIFNLSEKVDHKLQLCVPPSDAAHATANMWLTRLESGASLSNRGSRLRYINVIVVVLYLLG